MSWLSSIGAALGIGSDPGAAGFVSSGFDLAEAYRIIRGDSATTSPISPAEAKHNATVVACCRTVARLVSQIPLDSPDVRIQRLLNRPNDFQSPREFRHSIQFETSLWGNGYVRAIRGTSGQIVALAPLDSGQVQVGVSDTGQPVYRDDSTGVRRNFDRSDICHVRDGGTSEIVSPSRLEAGGFRVRLLIEADSLISSAFVTGISAQYTMESDNPVSGKKSKEIVAKLYNMLGRDGPRRNGVVVTGDMKLKRVPSVQVADSDLRQLRHDLQAEIASLYDLPPFQVSGEANVRFSNHTSQNVSILRDVVAPNAENLAEKLSMFLDGPVVPRLSEFLRGDWQLLSNTASHLAGGPVLTPDEVRRDFFRIGSVPGGDKLRARRDGLAPEGPGDREGEEPSDDGSTVIGGNE